jgi:DNA-binding transcriptional LysR family regulator
MRIAKAFVHSAALRIAELPCASPRVALALLWHRRFDNQPAHGWLRQQIETVAKRL